MHEFSVASSLIDTATTTVATHCVTRVKKLVLRIGVFCQIDDQLLIEAFGHLRIGTVCADAELEIVKCKPLAECPSCGARFDVKDWQWQCPRCSVDGDLVGGGDELELVSIDAETDE